MSRHDPPPPADFTDDERRLGERFLLSELPRLIASDGLPPLVAARIRDRLLRSRRSQGDAPAAALVVSTPSAPAAAAIATAPRARRAAQVPARPIGEVMGGIFGTGAPALLLYVGAFLIVVSAIIFVNVSGEQISDAVKLTLMLGGTIGFLVAGVVCWRFSRVQLAGRTFLIIGALVTPLDFVAYYVLVSGASPLTSPMLWTIGSVVCAVLYGALRIGGYGRWYSHLWLVSLLSAVGGAEAWSALPMAWAPLPFATLVLAVEAARFRGPRAIRDLAGPPVWLSTFVAALSGVALAAVSILVAPGERWAAVPLAVVLTAYAALRARDGNAPARALALAGPSAIALTVARAAGVTPAGLGLVLVGLAGAYAAVAFTTWGARRLRVPDWIRAWSARSCLLLAAAAALPAQAYLRELGIGAAVFIAAAALLAAIAFRWDPLVRPARPQGHLFAYAAAACLVLGYRLGLAAFGVAAIEEVSGRVAASVFPLTVVLAAVAEGLRLRGQGRHALAAGIAASAVSVYSMGLAWRDPPVLTTITLAYAVGAIAAALRLRWPLTLWGAAALSTVTAFGALRWTDAPTAWWPMVVAVPGALAFVAAQAAERVPVARSLAPHGPALARIATVSALVAIATSVGLMPARDPWDTSLWRLTIPVVLAAGAFHAFDAYRRRSVIELVQASFALPVAIEMAAFALRLTALEAYSLPLALYGFALALALRRHIADATLGAIATVAEYAGAALLILPTAYAGSSPLQIERLVASGTAALVLFAAGAWYRRAALVRVALAFFALAALRATAQPQVLQWYAIGLGALVLALATVSARFPRLTLTARQRTVAEIVGAALVAGATLVLSFDRLALADAQRLSVEVAVLVGAGAFFGRPAIVRAGLLVACAVAILGITHGGDRVLLAVLTGSFLVAVALATARLVPSRLAAVDQRALELVGVAVLMGPATMLTQQRADADRAIELMLGALAVVTLAARLGRGALFTAGLVFVGVQAVLVLAYPESRQLMGVGAGLYLVALSVAARRFLSRGLPAWAPVLLEISGAALFVAPTFLRTWQPNAVFQTALLMAQLLLLLPVGLAFHRRWLVFVALAVLGVQALRAVVDVVNRVPNWAIILVAGTLLIAAGFIGLVQRERWSRWQKSGMSWWRSWQAAGNRDGG